MADRNGYIGRAPSDSSVVVARQTFSATGITTTFTFASGYTIGYLDVFLNGAKQIEGQDYDANNGSTFDISGGGVTNGDIIEAVAYKAFNVSNVKDAPGDFTVGNNLTVAGNATISGTISGDGSALTGVAGGKFSANDTVISTTTSVGIGTTNASGAADTNNTAVLNVGVVTANFFYGNGANLTGVANTENVIGTAITMTTGNITGNLTVGGVLTYDDVTNVDSIGIVTARSGVKVVGGGVSITAGGLHVTAGITTVGGGLTLTDNVKAKFGSGGDLSLYHNGTNSFIDNDTGSLYIRGVGDDLYLRATDDIFIQPQGSEDGIKVIGNGAVELYHNNVNVLQTSDSGIVLKGAEGGASILEMYADEGDDNADKFRFHVSDGGPFRIQNYASGGWENNIICNGNGSVELHHDDSKKIETSSAGVTVTGTLNATTDVTINGTSAATTGKAIAMAFIFG